MFDELLFSCGTPSMIGRDRRVGRARADAAEARVADLARREFREHRVGREDRRIADDAQAGIAMVSAVTAVTLTGTVLHVGGVPFAPSRSRSAA